MASSQEILGRISAIVGVTALVITGGFVYVNGGFTPTGPTLVLDETGYGSMRTIVYLGLAIAFQFGAPLLCGLALLFGLSTKHLRSGKIGAWAGGVSLALYMLTISACLELV